MVSYSHLIKNIPQFVMIHTVKGLSIVNEAGFKFFFFFLGGVDFLVFFSDLAYVGNLISGSSDFSKFSLYIWKFLVHILL